MTSNSHDVTEWLGIPVAPRCRYVSDGRTAMVANNRQSSYPLSLLVETAQRITENGGRESTRWRITSLSVRQVQLCPIRW
jgi:hypothetical protein